MKFEKMPSGTTLGTCDHCEGPVTLDNFHRCSVQTKGGRINQSRHWHFCSDVCRAAWWEDPATEVLHEIHTPDTVHPHDAPAFFCSHDEAHAGVEMDRDIALKVHLRSHKDRDGSSAINQFECPCHINEWWKAPVEAHEKLPVTTVTPSAAVTPNIPIELPFATLLSTVSLAPSAPLAPNLEIIMKDETKIPTPSLPKPVVAKSSSYNLKLPPSLPPPLPPLTNIKTKIALGLTSATAVGVILWHIFGH